MVVVSPLAVIRRARGGLIGVEQGLRLRQAASGAPFAGATATPTKSKSWSQRPRRSARIRSSGSP
jgi:hypothetical protein